MFDILDAYFIAPVGGNVYSNCESSERVDENSLGYNNEANIPESVTSIF